MGSLNTSSRDDSIAGNGGERGGSDESSSLEVNVRRSSDREGDPAARSKISAPQNDRMALEPGPSDHPGQVCQQPRGSTGLRCTRLKSEAVSGGASVLRGPLLNRCLGAGGVVASGADGGQFRLAGATTVSPVRQLRVPNQPRRNECCVRSGFYLCSTTPESAVRSSSTPRLPRTTVTSYVTSSSASKGIALGSTCLPSIIAKATPRHIRSGFMTVIR